MTLFRIGLLLFSALLLNGCLGEDMDSCPPLMTYNLSIEFRYPGDDGKDIFNDKIDKADLFVYNDQGGYVTGLSLDKASLTLFAGAKLNLDPGTYRIVCWGNAAGHSRFAGIGNGSSFAGAFIQNSTIVNSVAANGDRLYYAPHTTGQAFSLTVPQQGTKTKIIDFTRAHICVRAYIKGFEDHSAQGDPLTPLVELTHIAPQYDFAMQQSGNPITYRAVSVAGTLDTQQLAVMEFHTPLFDADTPMQLIIKKQSDGTALTRVPLSEFIRDNNITIGNTADMTLDILIEYKQGSVEITLPGWGQTPVGPEL